MMNAGTGAPASDIGDINTFYSIISGADINIIEIPVIQRDYAQGRDSAESIRRYFISDLADALTGTGKPAFLDCVYGSLIDKRFIPIDGQQRLTTLYLLHWYIALRSGSEDAVKFRDSLLPKFTYEVRDSAREFCEHLSRANLKITDEDDNISDKIKKERWYHPGVMSADPTVKGMLVMLDEIHRQLRSKDDRKYGYDDLFGKLISDDCPIYFQWLKIENFGDDDELFIKLNARGKKLTVFERFKSDVEKGFIESNFNNPDLIEKWKEKIDNDWLMWFWQRNKTTATPEDAEDDMFRFILFVTYILFHQESNDNSAWDSSPDIKNVNFKYEDSIKIIMSRDNLERIMKMLDALPDLYRKKFPSDANVDFELIISGGDSDYKTCARLYAVLSFYISGASDSIFDEYYNVLRNIITAYREYPRRDSLYSSHFDQKNIGKFTKHIDDFILQIVKSGGVNEALISIDIDLPGYRFEKEKAKYIEKDRINRLSEVKVLEELPELRGLIQNILFEDKVWLDAADIQRILDNKKAFLQLVQIIYADNPRTLWRVSTRWAKEVYLWRYWMKANEYGDVVLTYFSDNEDDNFQKSVRECIREISNNKNKEITEILDEKRKNIVFNSYWDYIGKYDEFFVYDSICCQEFYKDMEGKPSYHLIICEQATRGPEDEKWDKTMKYNPFCKALANKLGINEPVFPEPRMDVLTLQNGNKIRIEPDGTWVFSDGAIEEKVNVNSGEDIIEQAFQYLRKKGIC